MQWKKLLCFYYVGIILFFFQGCAPTGGYGEFYQQNVFEKFPPTETVLVYQYSEESNETSPQQAAGYQKEGHWR